MAEPLSEQQLQMLQAQKVALLRQQKLLNVDIAAMEAELKRRQGLPMDIDQRLSQELVALNVELTGLAFDQLQCRLVSVDGGRVTSAWTVRALSLAADAALTVSYVTEREPDKPVVCTELEVHDHSAPLAPLVEAAGDDLHALLFGLYSLGRLTEERDAALPSSVDADRGADAWTVPLPGGGKLNWSIEFRPIDVQYDHVFSLTSEHGVEMPLPPQLQRWVSIKGCRALLQQAGVL